MFLPNHQMRNNSTNLHRNSPRSHFVPAVDFLVIDLQLLLYDVTHLKSQKSFKFPLQMHFQIRFLSKLTLESEIEIAQFVPSRNLSLKAILDTDLRRRKKFIIAESLYHPQKTKTPD
jgi:hypothetical protein